MARLVEQLTESKIRSITDCGLHADGRGLYLQLRPGGARSWIFRFTLNGRTRDMGLGALADVSLVHARAKAAEQRVLLTNGADPIEHAKAARAERKVAIACSGPSFEKCAEEYMADKLKRFRNEVHRRQWQYSMRTLAYPIIGQRQVAEIGTQDVLNVLNPIWEIKCETAKRLLNRINKVLAWATVKGHRSGANPATWRGHLQEALPSRAEVQPVKHHTAMDYRDVPAFMIELTKRTSVSAAALQFLILTAARSGEVLGARWGEIDLTGRTWTIPAARAKTKRQHVVPLSTGALSLLQKMDPLRDLGAGFIFPGLKGGGLSAMALLALMQRRMKRDVTIHGFRSSFRDWCGDEANVPRDLAEAALAHVVGNSTERAYRRRTAIELRRDVMQTWCDYCLPPAPSNVVDITARREAAATAA